MSMPYRGQSLTPTENVSRGFILHSTLPAQWTVYQRQQVEVPMQGRIKLNPDAPIGSRYQFSSLSLPVGVVEMCSECSHQW
jgi:hypothetical protein